MKTLGRELRAGNRAGSGNLNVQSMDVRIGSVVVTEWSMGSTPACMTSSFGSELMGDAVLSNERSTPDSGGAWAGAPPEYLSPHDALPTPRTQ